MKLKKSKNDKSDDTHTRFKRGTANQNYLWKWLQLNRNTESTWAVIVRNWDWQTLSHWTPRQHQQTNTVSLFNSTKHTVTQTKLRWNWLHCWVSLKCFKLKLGEKQTDGLLNGMIVFYFADVVVLVNRRLKPKWNTDWLNVKVFEVGSKIIESLWIEFCFKWWWASERLGGKGGGRSIYEPAWEQALSIS